MYSIYTYEPFETTDETLEIFSGETYNNQYIDCVVMGVDTIFEFEENKKQIVSNNPITIAILDSMEQYDIFKNFKVTAWVLKNEISKIHSLLDAKLVEIEAKRKIFTLENELQRQRVYNNIHIKNYDLIENIISDSTRQISLNFERNLDVLKKVCNRIEKIDTDGIVADELASATNSMHEYISILQCEDRLFQILNGISSITDKAISNIDQLVCSTQKEYIEQFQLEMVPHYTIQEQRDIASNKDTNTKEQQHSAGTLELF